MLKSKPFSERFALIELADSHDECLLTQIHALKSCNCWVLLVTNEHVRERNHYLESLVDEWINIDHRPKKQRKGLTGAAVGDALIIRRLMRTLKQKDIHKVIFNTAQGGHVRNACLFSLFRKMEFIGVIHTIRKFKGSFTQRVIHLKIKKYFVLGEFLASDAMVISAPLNHRGGRNRTLAAAERSRSHRNIQISSFYPVDFPTSSTESLHEENHIHIALIGSVETRRKDLEGFISLVQQCDSSVHFHFLGKADPTHTEVIRLKERLAEIQALSRVAFYDSFVNFDTINLILRKTNAILPLVHPDTPSAEEYFRHQVPGSMNMALGYRIPLLLHANYRSIEELAPAAIYYELDGFQLALERLKLRENDIRSVMKSHVPYSSNFQYERYLNVVMS